VTFSMIDLIFIALIGLFSIRGFLKGIISEFLSMAAIVLGLSASLFLYKNGGAVLRSLFWPDSQALPEIAAFVILFLAVFILVKILEKMIKGIINAVCLGAADSYLGLVFGLAEGIVVVSLILFIIMIQPLFNADDLISGSFFANLLLPYITGKEEMPWLFLTEASGV